MAVGASWPWVQGQQPNPDRPRPNFGQPTTPQVPQPPREDVRGSNGSGGGSSPADHLRQRLDVQEKNGIYELTIDFPSKNHPQRTSWRVQCSTGPVGTAKGMRENFVIRAAFFKPGPDKPEIQVLGMTHLAESLVAYSNGVRYYDIGVNHTGMIPISDSDIADQGIIIDKNGKRLIAAELHDRGLLWKDGHGGHASKRGEVFQLWSTLSASNYLYMAQYGFQDDGTISIRMGSTGSNLQAMLDHYHMHLGIWRIDVDLADAKSDAKANNVYVVRHKEPTDQPQHSTTTLEPFNGGVEGSLEWNDKEFTSLRIQNPGMRNAVGNPVAYDLVPLRTGTQRHFGSGPPDEAFTHGDFWVLPFTMGKNNNIGELSCSNLPNYVKAGRSIENKDVVIWYISSAHHMPRDEDLQGPPGSRQTGATLVLWSGFELRPRSVFDSTPMYP